MMPFLQVNDSFPENTQTPETNQATRAINFLE
jgi:hypothetical protein